jgi:hypothetical protein
MSLARNRMVAVDRNKIHSARGVLKDFPGHTSKRVLDDVSTRRLMCAHHNEIDVRRVASSETDAGKPWRLRTSCRYDLPLSTLRSSRFGMWIRDSGGIDTADTIGIDFAHVPKRTLIAPGSKFGGRSPGPHS